jgi:hypothetical protein
MHEISGVQETAFEESGCFYFENIPFPCLDERARSWLRMMEDIPFRQFKVLRFAVLVDLLTRIMLTPLVFLACFVIVAGISSDIFQSVLPAVFVAFLLSTALVVLLIWRTYVGQAREILIGPERIVFKTKFKSVIIDSADLIAVTYKGRGNYIKVVSKGKSVVFLSRVKELNELVEAFKAANPDIDISEYQEMYNQETA